MNNKILDCCKHEEVAHRKLYDEKTDSFVVESCACLECGCQAEV